MTTQITPEAVRDLLSKQAAPSQVAWAKAHGIAPSYVSDVIKGRKDPGPMVLDALGLERVIVYRRKAA